MFIKALQKRDISRIRRLLSHFLEDQQQHSGPNALWICNTGNMPDADYDFEEKLGVLVDHGKLTVGFATMNESGQIELLCVHRDYRNRNVATALLKFMMRTAKKLRIQSLRVLASENSRDFYLKAGFEKQVKSENDQPESNMTRKLSLPESDCSSEI